MFDFSENIWYNHTVITNKGRCDMKPLSKSQQKIFDYLKECAGECILYVLVEVIHFQVGN